MSNSDPAGVTGRHADGPRGALLPDLRPAT